VYGVSELFHWSLPSSRSDNILRMAEKKLAARIHAFTWEVYVEFGACIGIYVSYVKVNGKKAWGL
jgi:hypothetical protein